MESIFLYARSNVVFRKIHHCSASVFIKVNLIKTYCAPYYWQLWVNHSKCSYKLRVAYNNAYRRVLGYVKSNFGRNYIYAYNRVENYDAHNRHLIYSLRSRLLDSDNQNIACLNECFYIRGRYMWTSWPESLYM